MDFALVFGPLVEKYLYAQEAEDHEFANKHEGSLNVGMRKVEAADI